MRSDTTEIETCRNELTDQHRTLTLIARTLNSTRSSKRAKETGVLEARLQEQLHALEVRFLTPLKHFWQIADFSGKKRKICSQFPSVSLLFRRVTIVLLKCKNQLTIKNFQNCMQ